MTNTLYQPPVNFASTVHTDAETYEKLYAASMGISHRELSNNVNKLTSVIQSASCFCNTRTGKVMRRIHKIN